MRQQQLRLGRITLCSQCCLGCDHAHFAGELWIIVASDSAFVVAGQFANPLLGVWASAVNRTAARYRALVGESDSAAESPEPHRILAEIDPVIPFRVSATT